MYLMAPEIISRNGEKLPSSCSFCIARIRGSEGQYCDPSRLSESQPLFCFRRVRKGTGNTSALTLLRKKLLK